MNSLEGKVPAWTAADEENLKRRVQRGASLEDGMAAVRAANAGIVDEATARDTLDLPWTEAGRVRGLAYRDVGSHTWADHRWQRFMAGELVVFVLCADCGFTPSEALAARDDRRGPPMTAAEVQEHREALRASLERQLALTEAEIERR